MTQPKPAVLWKRLFATLYDILILTAVSLLYGAIATAISSILFNNAAQEYRPNATGVFVQLGWLTTIIGFYCFFWLRVGQTVAMKAWRLKLVTDSEKPLSIQTCILRCILGALSLACFGLGYLWAIFDIDKKTFHDKLTGTKVVQLDKNG